MRAFHEFMRKSNPERVEGLWEKLEEFAASHEIVSLSTLQSAEQGRRYLLVWDTKWASEGGWNDPPPLDRNRF